MEFWLSLLMTLGLFVGASAQSGRINEPPPTPTPVVRSQEQSDTTAKFRIDPKADQYRLVFPTYYDGIFRKGELYYVGEESNQARPSVNNSFIERLNEAGQQGYRLVSTTGSFPVAIVKLDEVQYEYSWFQTSGAIFSKDGFMGIYSQLSKQGFHLCANRVVNRACENFDLAGSTHTTCVFTDFFLLERQKGVTKVIEHRLAFAGPSWRMKTGPKLTTQVVERLSQGFYPTKVLSKFEILLEQREQSDDLWTDKSDVKVITSGWRDDLLKLVNELAKQEYRIALVNRGIAVMYRKNDASGPVSYISLNTENKDFEKQLAQAQARGAVYRTTYPTEGGFETKLIFELKAVDDHTRREYKVLKFEFQYTPNAAEKKVHKDLTATSKETLKMLNVLVKEGFVVRDLFYSDKVSVLLERTQ